MRDVVAWIRRRALWSLPLLGVILVVSTLWAWREGYVRQAFMHTNRYGVSLCYSLNSNDVQRITRLDTDAALAACDALELRGPKRELDVLRARVLAQAGRVPDAELAAYLGRTEEPGVWHLAVDQTLELRKGRGDVEGANALLEDLARGRLGHPDWEALPFPFLRNWGAMELARRLAAVDPRRAHAWALRAKRDVAVDFPSFCGDSTRYVFEETEALLEATARQAGFSYAKEAFDRGRFNRRFYGPDLVEGGVRVLVGLVLVIGGAVLIGGTPRSRRFFTWSFFWRRRGRLARFGLGTYVLGFALSLVLALKPTFVDGPFPPDDTTLLLVGLISLAYTAVLIPFIGAFIAGPTASSGS